MWLSQCEVQGRAGVSVVEVRLHVGWQRERFLHPPSETRRSWSRPHSSGSAAATPRPAPPRRPIAACALLRVTRFRRDGARDDRDDKGGGDGDGDRGGRTWRFPPDRRSASISPCRVPLLWAGQRAADGANVRTSSVPNRAAVHVGDPVFDGRKKLQKAGGTPARWSPTRRTIPALQEVRRTFSGWHRTWRPAAPIVRRYPPKAKAPGDLRARFLTHEKRAFARRDAAAAKQSVRRRRGSPPRRGSTSRYLERASPIPRERRQGARSRAPQTRALAAQTHARRASGLEIGPSSRGSASRDRAIQ